MRREGSRPRPRVDEVDEAQLPGTHYSSADQARRCERCCGTGGRPTRMAGTRAERELWLARQTLETDASADRREACEAYLDHAIELDAAAAPSMTDFASATPSPCTSPPACRRRAAGPQTRLAPTPTLAITLIPHRHLHAHQLPPLRPRPGAYHSFAPRARQRTARLNNMGQPGWARSSPTTRVARHSSLRSRARTSSASTAASTTRLP